MKTLKNDFYEFINKDWLRKAQIPADRSSISAFVELDLELEKLLKTLLMDWSTKKRELPSNKHIKEMVNYFSMIMDVKKREELGWEPIRKHIQKLEKLNSFEEIFAQDQDFWRSTSQLPVGISLHEDFKDSSRKIVWLDGPSTILPAKETYEKEEAKDFLATWKNMVVDLLVDYGKTKEEALKLADLALEFDNINKDIVLSALEQADYVSLYNLKLREELEKVSKNTDFIAILDKTVGQKVTEASVVNLRFTEQFDSLFSKENFEKYKAFMIIFSVLSFCSDLSEKIREKATEFSRKINSIDEVRQLEKFAYDKADALFSMPFGLYYANEFFGKEAKKDIENMVFNMIEVYKKRLKENTWLSKETIEKALLKLSKMDVMIGFPEKIQPYYDNFKTTTYEQGGDLVSNSIAFSKVYNDYAFSLYHKDESKEYWSMSPATVNAYFNPMKNHIVFPAAILASPYYDAKRSKSANYGAIGVVIAHEISHAFDNNGAQFDENGKLNNWWTEEDLKQFQERTQKAIELYDKRETEFGPVNGQLTVSENIADLGGFACALEAAQMEKDFSATDFFEAWAVSWRNKMKESAAKRRLETDVHSPGKIRANVVLGNSELFQQTYNIQKEDKMYVSKEKMVKIW
ncbi:M13 family metallopeptidase [Mycoplasma procyoni]|uniref:M13 family metallopeptidase n=1 Tax=Mycoplasma procyoni TaxID=568784 RepID=UPI00197BCA03|nr:M13 family metallopeptidase [Mycoplasma procyoni]MBN3534801.1 M13 family metallopeptidase [Mycoplasma procyoni]